MGAKATMATRNNKRGNSAGHLEPVANNCKCSPHPAVVPVISAWHMIIISSSIWLLLLVVVFF